MFITVQIALADDTTDKEAAEIAQSVCNYVVGFNNQPPVHPMKVDNAYYNVQEGDGNDLGL